MPLCQEAESCTDAPLSISKSARAPCFISYLSAVLGFMQQPHCLSGCGLSCATGGECVLGTLWRSGDWFDDDFIWFD